MMAECDVELLRRIAEVEDGLDPESLAGKLGWRSRDAGVWPGTLAKLRMQRLVEDVFESNSYHGYRLSQKARAMLAPGAPAGSAEAARGDSPALPGDLFADIIGHDGVKDLLRACLAAEKPVHVLLAGPPALAKSLFLWDIERALGEKALWLVGSATSKAGLWDLVAERQPQIILIDELDKMNAADTAALLSLMEGGRLVRAKKGRELNLSHQMRVVAASNRLDRLAPELKSRFAIRKLAGYNRSDYLAVVKGVLATRENLAEELAGEVARRLDGVSQDVRDAIRVARLAPQLGIDKAIKLLIGGNSYEK